MLGIPNARRTVPGSKSKLPAALRSIGGIREPMQQPAFALLFQLPQHLISLKHDILSSYVAAATHFPEDTHR
jgi:hypothetical protein